MKRRLLGISAACALIAATGSVDVRADKVPLAQLPDAVKKAVKEHSQGETLQHVERETKDGQAVYEAEFKREGVNRRVTFAADGSVMKSTDLADASKTTPSVALGSLPEPVQRTIRAQQAGRTLVDIDKETWNGQPVYEVEFKEDGPNSRIHIANDGAIVMDKRPGRGLFMGMQLAETPKPVQDTVKRVAGSEEIADVDRKTKDGKVYYQVEIRQEGLNRHLEIAESGALLKDTDARGTAPGLRDRVRGAADRIGDVFDRDTDGATMSLEQLPAAVQSTIKSHGEMGSLKPIKREMKDGVTQYHVEFEKDGKNKHLFIGEDGRVLNTR